MLVVFAVCAVRIVRVLSEFGTTLSVWCVCVGSAVAVGVAIVVLSVTWMFVAEGELTGTGRSAAFEVRVVIEMRWVVLGEGVLCEMCICLAGGGVGGVGGEWVRGLGKLGLVILGGDVGEFDVCWCLWWGGVGWVVSAGGV